jgi:transposase InsO family protein
LLENECLRQGLGITFEYTAPGTPQHNGRIERRFPTIYGRVRSTMNKARIRKKIGEGLWTECASMTTKHANMMVTPNQTVPSHQQFYGTKAYYARSLREWGEIGIVTDEAKNKINPKLDNKGHPCMLVNYAENHQSNVYRMWDLKTHRIVISRDILWLNKSYGDFIQDKKTDVDNAINDDELYEQEEPQNTTTGRVEDHN